MILEGVGTVREAWARCAALLREAGIENAGRESEDLVSEVLGKPRSGLWAGMGERMNPESEVHLNSLSARRAAREPLQLILGSWTFMGLSFRLRPGVFIPRPETEVLAHFCLERLGKGHRVLDLGLGSGVLLGSILALGPPEVRGLGVERSEEACGLASLNLGSLGLGGRAQILRGHWTQALAPRPLFDIIVSNPPYVDPALKSSLEPELAWDPPSALYAGEEGLEDIRVLVERAGAHLKPGGWLVLETGSLMVDRAAALFGPSWTAVETLSEVGSRPLGVAARLVQPANSPQT